MFFSITSMLLAGTLYLFREVLTPFVLAIVLAYVLAPVVERLERVRLGARPVPRWVAVLTVYLTLLGTLAASIALGAPRVASEVQQLSGEVPRVAHRLQNEWVPELERRLSDFVQIPVRQTEDVVEQPAGEPLEGTTVVHPEPSTREIRVSPSEDGGFVIHLPERGLDVIPVGHGYRIHPATEPPTDDAPPTVSVGQMLRQALNETEASTATFARHIQSFFAALFDGIFRFFIMLMLSAYLLLTRRKIYDFFQSLVRPERRERFDELARRIDRGLTGVVRGQISIALVNGLLTGIGFWLADLRYWPVLTLIATVLSLIPIFGSILSTIPAVIIGLQEGFGTALFVLFWVIGIHQVEAHLLNPKIMGDSAKVHPVLVIFALLAGEHLYGIVGALVAVPTLSISQSLFLHFRETALGVPKDSRPTASTSEESASPT